MPRELATIRASLAGDASLAQNIDGTSPSSAANTWRRLRRTSAAGMIDVVPDTPQTAPQPNGEQLLRGFAAVTKTVFGCPDPVSPSVISELPRT